MPNFDFRKAPPLNTRTAPMPLSGRNAQGDGLEWDQLPILSDSIAQRLALLLERHRRDTAARDASAQHWTRTQAAEFDALPLSSPFHEATRGLAMREMDEPAVFSYFFGAARRS
jgi:hypothetical protein